ncbi:MAG: tripartite tricarboxylate transporter TctB family protein [Betaproteobacteria bacterium]|nr:tripartite tricarboxylate transporter TctB family protein [Betaproteobacteria bacterium]
MADRVIFACIVILAGIYFYATAQIPSLEIGDPLGPKAFPRLLGIGLLVTAGMLLLEMWRESANKSDTSGQEPKGDHVHLYVIGGVSIWTALYFLVFERFGYVVASTLYLLALMAYFNRGKWIANVTTAVLFAVGSYGMFNYLLGVSLPKGFLPY